MNDYYLDEVEDREREDMEYSWMLHDQWIENLQRLNTIKGIEDLNEEDQAFYNSCLNEHGKLDEIDLETMAQMEAQKNGN